MSSYIIPVHGLIGSAELPDDNTLYFSLDKFLLHINKAQEFDSIELDIASDGGYVDVADKMIEVLKATKKPIITRNSGNVCSSASKLFTIAPKENRYFDPSKGVFLIHNPFTITEGTADELAQTASELQKTEDEYVKWYVNATGAEQNVVRAFMDENKPLTPEQIESLGFATLVKPTVNAIAKLKSSNTMINQKEFEEKTSKFMQFIDSVLAKFRPKAIMLADANGQELEFPELTDANELAVGATVNLGGNPAEGEFQMPDGTVLVCAGGKVAEIRPASGDELQALKDENASLKTELEKLKGEKTAAEAKLTETANAVEEVKKEFKAFKAQFSTGVPAGGNPPDDGKTIRKPFKTKE